MLGNSRCLVISDKPSSPSHWKLVSFGHGASRSRSSSQKADAQVCVDRVEGIAGPQGVV